MKRYRRDKAPGLRHVICRLQGVLNVEFDTKVLEVRV